MANGIFGFKREGEPLQKPFVHFVFFVANEVNLGKTLLAWSLLASLLLLPGITTAEVQARDATGHLVTLPAPAQRILSLAPHTTELLFAAGAGGRVIGRVRYSDHPPEALKIPLVGDALHLDLEAILRLRPDLVVAWGSGNSQAVLSQLKRLGLAVFVSEPESLEDIASEIEALGSLSGHDAEARRMAKSFRSRRDALASKYGQGPKRRVFYQLWHQPLMSLGGRHLISQVIGLCGGQNIFANLKTLVPSVTLEAVLAANPEVIINGGHGSKDWRERWRRWPSLGAVRTNTLLEVNPDLLQRSGPRVLEGAESLCRLLTTNGHSD